MENITEFDIVALKENITVISLDSEEILLEKGYTGTIVHDYKVELGTVEVEFFKEEKTIAIVTLLKEHLELINKFS